MEGESSEKEKLGSDVVVEVVNDDGKVQEIEEGNKIPVPKSGMRFPGHDEMFEYWKSYAHQMGFTVRKRSSKKDESGILKYVCFVCSKSTRQERNPTKPARPGCNCKLSGRLDRGGEWIVSNITLEHNHELVPSKVENFSVSGPMMISNAKRRLDVNGNVAKEAGYCIGRLLQLGEGDVVAIMNYFLKKKEQNSGFFYSMDLDEEGQLKNVFWADGRSREAYKEFGEVVTFDTTYLGDKYNMPLAFFVGVNHHGEPTLLGCGLICSKDSESFIWLFRTWLACMSDCAPNGIITDQDTSMQKAVEIVFLNTRHRWCLWHVMKKLFEKLRGYKEYESIWKILQSVVYESQNPVEFEQSWTTMVEEHGLHQNEWLSGLYCERHRWVPCFVKTSFWAGMSTTQRSESLNSFFEGYVNSTTTLKQFMEQYDNALRSRVEKENQSDIKSFSQLVPCVTRYEMEKQIQEVYTISKFKEFQTEVIGKMYCEFTLIKEDHIVPEYDIREDVKVGEGKKRMTFTVTLNRNECEVKCSCHMFEYRGTLCRHAISVLIRNDVGLIPEKYILRRWRKDVRRCHTCVKMTYDGASATSEQQRYDKMFSAFTNLAFLAAEDETSYTCVMAVVENVTKELQLRRENSGHNQPIPNSAAHTSSLPPRRENSGHNQPIPNSAAHTSSGYTFNL